MIWRAALPLLIALSGPAGAGTACALDFTLRVTQGVGEIRPGTELQGHADFAATGRSLRQEGGATAHLATGRIRLGAGIEGAVWTLVTTARDSNPDLVGLYAREVTGLTHAGVAFDGPMALTLFGPPGTRPAAVPPLEQAEWDALSLRRALTLSAQGRDMLAGEVTELTADCRED